MKMATVEFFKDNNKNRNTTHATNTWIRCFENWAKDSGRPWNVLSMDKIELNSVLEIYFAEAVRKDGKQYEPSSLGCIQSGIDRYLRENGSVFSIMKDAEFSGSRSVIEGRAKYLRELGMGKKPYASDSFTKAEEDILWNCGALGSHSAEALTNTMHMFLTMHLGLRGRQEHHVMCVEDFVYKVDDSGDQYITFKEGLTKTRFGGTRVKTRKTVPKMFENRVPGRCPLLLFEQFLLRRPVDMRKSGVFYLAVIQNPAGEVWFKSSNMEENTIDNIVKNMVRKTPLSSSTKNFTNHSWRKTTTKRMRNAGASRSEIIEVTGHSHESGLDPYDSGDDFQAKKMSYAIDSVPPPVPVRCMQSDASSSGTHPQAERRQTVPYREAQPPSERTFRMFSDEMYEKFEQPAKNPVYNFQGCTVNINYGNATQPVKKTMSRKRVMIASDSESSQE